jgi:hypothetical protein
MQRFWFVAFDDDNKTFSIEGPMTNDQPWNAAVCRLRESGRNIRCQTSDLHSSREQLQKEGVRMGYTEAASPVVTPSMAEMIDNQVRH